MPVWCPPCNVSIPFASGKSFARRDVKLLEAAELMSQSPSHRGSLSHVSRITVLHRNPGLNPLRIGEVFRTSASSFHVGIWLLLSQSPSHRGSLSHGETPSLGSDDRQVSIPFASGKSFAQNAG